MKLNNLLVIIIACVFTFSCSKDDIEETNPIVINSIKSSKQLAFIEETINLNIYAEGYSNIEVSSSNSDVVIDKINTTTYKISATKATEVIIEIILSSESFTEQKTVEYNFFEHGVIDFKIVEGITLDKDSPNHVLELHGDPDYIFKVEDENREVWYYFDKGFWVSMDSNVNRADYIRLYGIDWTRTLDNIEYIGKQYRYEISEGLKIENLQLSMTTVVEKFGTPTEKLTTSIEGLYTYVYEDLDVFFYFQSEDIDDFEGKSVGYIIVY